MVGLLAVFLVYPIVLTVWGGFVKQTAAGPRFTLEHLLLIFEDSTLLSGLFNSLRVAATTTFLAMAIGFPLAVLSAGYRFRGKSFFNAVVLVPMILPPFVGAIGVRAILGRQGALNELLGVDWDILGQARFWGVVAVQALSLYPIIYLNATASLANLDPALDEAAENLGSGWWRRFSRITLPLVRPGLFAGGTIVFIWSFTELGTPLMFDYYQVTPVQIFYGLKEVENSARPYALTLVLLTCSVGLYIIGRVLFGKKGHAMYSKASRAGGEKALTGWASWLAAGAFAVVTLLAVLPHLGVVVTSVTAPGQWYRSVLPTRWTGAHFNEALTAPDSFGSIVNSLKLASAAMVADIVLGVITAYILVRTRVRGRGVLDALCMLPLAVPGLVMAFGYVAMSLRWPFGKDGPLGSVVSVIAADPNPVPLLIIAYSVRRLPYIVRSTVAGLEQTSGELEEAAVNLGASRLTAVRKVIVPLIMANLIAGGLLVFSFSMLEVSDSMILAQQTRDYPITKAIFAFMERLGDGPYIASAMGVWGMALLTVTLFGASALLGKKLGSIFRV
ncbi:MAG: iron ABC transporter permease [Phycisphaerales bacterium]|nr:iron ABC transporter permease [Phycisphaerales bacterium]